MTRHDDCMFATALLELELYGEILSDSIRDHVTQLNRRRIDRLLQFGGTRAIEHLRESSR